MDYKEKYEKALERAKAIYQGSYKPDTAATIAETLQNVFPELNMNISFYEKDIQRILKENKLYYDWSIDHNDGEISILVEWGDWKHDHQYLRYIMHNNHYRETKIDITEENGSDCYSAIHYFEYGA